MKRSWLLLTTVLTGALSLGSATALGAPSKKKDKKSADKSEDKADADAEAEAEAEAESDSEEEDSLDLSVGDDADDAGDGGGAALAPAVGSGMKGRVGLMGTRTLSGLNGVSVRYYALNKLSLGLTVGAATFTHKEADDNGEFKQNNTVGLFGVGPSVFYWPYQGSRKSQVHADFGVGARALVFLGFTGANDDDAQDTLEDPIEIDVEIPVSAQVWIGRRVSIAPEFGVTFRIIPGSREPNENGESDSNPGSGVGERLGTTNGPGLGFELGSTAGLFMGLHVGYWFGKLN